MNIIECFQSTISPSKLIILINNNLIRYNAKYLDGAYVEIPNINLKLDIKHISGGHNNSGGELNVVLWVDLPQNFFPGETAIIVTLSGKKYMYNIIINNLTNIKVGAIAIATIIKDETRYLNEWIKHHVALGVSKVYLYDNYTTDNKALVSEVKKINDKLKVDVALIIPFSIRKFLGNDETLIKTKQNPFSFHEYVAQAEYLIHSLHKYGGYHERMIFCDVDEFFYIPPGLENNLVVKPKNLLQVLTDNKWINAIVQTYSFGCSKDKSCNTVLQSHVYRKSNTEGPYSRTKCIIDPKRILIMGVHQPLFLSDGSKINPYIIDNTVLSHVDPTVLRINHYMFRNNTNRFYREAAIKDCPHGDYDLVYDDMILGGSGDAINMAKKLDDPKANILLLTVKKELLNINDLFYYYDRLTTTLFTIDLVKGKLLFKEFIDYIKSSSEMTTIANSKDNIGRIACKALFYE